MEQTCFGSVLSPINHHKKIARTTKLALIAPFLLITSVFASSQPGRASDEKAGIAIAQQKRQTISGTVLDKNGEPIIGANVVVKGTTNGTITDMDGKYALDVPENALLQISY